MAAAVVFNPLGGGAVAGGAIAAPTGTGVLAPLADDAAIYEYSYTQGNAGVYQLAGAWGAHFPFSSEFQDGAVLKIRVTDDSANTEISEAQFNIGANTLTVLSIIGSTNNGAAVNWSGRTRLLVHALVPGLPLCSDVPQDGDVLTWVQALNDGAGAYCPEPPVPPPPPPPPPPSPFYISFSYGSTFDSLPSDPFDGKLEIFDCVMPVDVTFAFNLRSSPTPICEVAPISDVQLILETWVGGVRTASGTLTYPTGSLTGNYTFSSLVLPKGDRLRLVIDPIQDDGVIAGIAGTIVGTR